MREEEITSHEEKYPNNSALVIGGGIGGIKAALDLAEMGHKVHLLEDSPYIGGTLSKLDRQFPTNDCGMCKMLPSFGDDFCQDMCLRRGFVHPNINIITNAHIVGLEGQVGDFTASLNKRARYVDPEKCVACGLCVDVCPIEVGNEFNSQLSKRKAIYIDYPSAAPKVFTVDYENCNKCGECVKICPTNAVDLSNEEENMQLKVGAVILALGFTPFDPNEMSALHYDELDNVITALEFERIISGTGPEHDRILIRPSDKKVPKKIAFLQCIGSRNETHNYCSYACCMHTLKEAMMAKETNPDLDITIFYMDMRVFGKGYHRYYENARKMGIKFVRSRVADIQMGEDKELIVNIVDETDTPLGKSYDMAILATGQLPPAKAKELSEILGIELNKHGFADTKSESPTKTSKDGVFVCGSFSGPKDIPDTIVEASCAVEQAHLVLERESSEKSDEPFNNPEIEKKAIGIFICGSDSCLGNSLHIKEIMDYVGRLSNVESVNQLEFICLEIHKMKELAQKENIGKVIIAACSPYPFEDKFKSALSDIDINRGQVEIVDLREGCAWVHKDKEKATEKAKGLLAMAYEKLRFSETQMSKGKALSKQVLILGGGIAGLNCAYEIAQSNYEVDLIELESQLGGNAKYIHYTLDGMEVQNYLKGLIEKVKQNKSITIHTNSEVLDISKKVGNFIARIQTSEEEKIKSYGAVVVATGASEIQSLSHKFGEHNSVITQRELEKLLVTGKCEADNIVMIQCVEIRNENRKYCGRICCQNALKNALKIKEKNPRSQVHILYQDIMTYGLWEEYFIKAKDMGVNFIRYNLKNKPEVSIEEESLILRIKEPVLDEMIILAPDLVVLSLGPAPDVNNTVKDIFEADLRLDDDGFFGEANVKFRPMDFVEEGIFVCGLAHSPRTIPESISQSSAVAGKVTSLLSKQSLYPRQVVSEVHKRWCVGCEACVSACPYHARVIASSEKVAEVVEALCKGCGICAVVCPSAAAKLRGYKDDQILAMIDEAVS